MAYLRITKRASGQQYYYICKSIRRSDKVTTKVLEYLGANVSPERLAEAKRYWRVGQKRKGGK
jgi:hypothetical protein